MNYDTQFRFRRALQPEGLTILATAAAALADAINDARNAGQDPEVDPAVHLLARHVGRLSIGASTGNEVEDAGFRSACLERIAAQKQDYSLTSIVRRGQHHDLAARRAFVEAAATRLRELAFEIGLGRSCFDLVKHTRHHNRASVELHSETLFVEINFVAHFETREISFRRARSRTDSLGGRTYHADIGELDHLTRFAERCLRETHAQITPSTLALA